MHALPSPGQVIDERYELLAFVGQGGMGAVYLARQVDLGHTVAIKFLAIDGDEALARFWREGQLLSQLQHANIVMCLGSGIWLETLPYLVFEFLTGETLRKRLNREAVLPFQECVRLSLQICSGLARAHAAGVIHRDLKPENIMLVEKDGCSQVKILDFGLARIAADASADVQKLTQTGHLLGTASYMSPEQCSGQTPDGRSDIYSLGCIMYEALSGNPPHLADNAMGIICQRVHNAPAPLPDDCGAPADLKAIIFTCLARQSVERYQTAADLQADLEHVMDGKPLSALPVQGPGKTLSRRSVMVIVLSLVVTIFFLLVFCLSDPGPAWLIDRGLAGVNAGKRMALLEAAADWFVARQRPKAANFLYGRAISAVPSGSWADQVRLARKKAIALVADGKPELARDVLGNAFIEIAKSQEGANLTIAQVREIKPFIAMSRALFEQVPPSDNVHVLTAICTLKIEPSVQADNATLQQLYVLSALGSCRFPLWFDTRRLFNVLVDLESQSNYAEMQRLLAYLLRYGQFAHEHDLLAGFRKQAELCVVSQPNRPSILLPAMKHFFQRDDVSSRTKIKLAVDLHCAYCAAKRLSRADEVRQLLVELEERTESPRDPLFTASNNYLQARKLLTTGRYDLALLLACRAYVAQGATLILPPMSEVIREAIGGLDLNEKIELTEPEMVELRSPLIRLAQIPGIGGKPGAKDDLDPPILFARFLVLRNRWADANRLVAAALVVTSADKLPAWRYWLASAIATQANDLRSARMCSMVVSILIKRFGRTHPEVAEWSQVLSICCDKQWSAACAKADELVKAKRLAEAEALLRRQMLVSEFDLAGPSVNKVRMLSRLASVLVLRHKSAEAKELLNKAAHADPTFFFFVAEVYWDEGRCQDALANYDKVDLFKLEKCNVEYAKQSVFHQANCMALLDRCAQAEGVLRAGIQRYSDVPGSRHTYMDARMLHDLQLVLRQLHRDQEADALNARLSALVRQLAPQAGSDVRRDFEKWGFL